MRKLTAIKWMMIIAASTFVTSCKKNYTRFFEDQHADNLSVFSDKAYNIMTCYINDIPYRTDNWEFKGGIFSRNTSIDINVTRMIYNADSDTLFFSWYSSGFSDISLVLPVSKDYSRNDFNSLQGKRMIIDGNNGYFRVSNYSHEKATGTIYFHNANINRNDSTVTDGILSGLFEATAPSYKITKGRFDHSLSGLDNRVQNVIP